MLMNSVFAVIDYYYFRTNGDYSHEEFLATTELTYMVFEVKAEMRAQVALLYDPDNISGIVNLPTRFYVSIGEHFQKSWK